ncbi:MAG: hypothetical protein MJ101_03750 [Clostridia bacterium]|nr:hypothetical protein [Clostridia bacterium]
MTNDVRGLPRNNNKRTNVPDRDIPDNLRLLYDYGPTAIGNLISLAESDQTPLKEKIDLYKYLFEQIYGKSPLTSKGESQCGAVVLNFEGKLDEWSN